MADADDKFLSWEKWEHDQNERFKELQVPFEVATVLNVTIKRGYEIKRTSILNLIDTPNPQIEVQYKGAKGPTNLPTTTKLNTKNPVWEEKLTFVIDEGSNAEEQQEEMLLKFILVVEDWHAQRSRIAEACYNTADLQIGLSLQETISFGHKGHITVEMCKQSRNTPDLRISLSLCDAEMKFRKQRMAKVMKSLQKTLGCDSPKDLFETPTMSVVGSGGGIRAAIGLSSFMETLDEVGLLDSMAYAVGTSGSAWYLLGAYIRQALTGKSRDSYRDWMRASFHTELQRQCVKLTNICKFRREQRIKDKAGQPTSLVEYFGLCVTDQVIGEQYEASKLSDMRDYVETANAPFPIFSTLEANDYEDVWKYHGHCNLSPFECELPHYAVNLDTMLLNSEFHSGILCRKLQEPSIPFICGAAGSIFAKRLNRILGIDEFEQTDLPNFNADSECSGTERNARKSIWQRTMEWLNNMPLILNRDAFIKRTAKVLNFVRGCSSLKRFPNNPFFQELQDGGE